MRFNLNSLKRRKGLFIPPYKVEYDKQAALTDPPLPERFLDFLIFLILGADRLPKEYSSK
jgi:hypothetical protein